MAKFDDMSPNAIRSTRIFLPNGDEVAKVSDGKVHPCWHCGEGTDWADFSFEAYLCSEECLAAKTEEYKDCLEHADEECNMPFCGHYFRPLTEAE